MAADADAAATWSRGDAGVATAGGAGAPTARPGAGAGADRLSFRTETEEMWEPTPVRDPFLQSGKFHHLDADDVAIVSFSSLYCDADNDDRTDRTSGGEATERSEGRPRGARTRRQRRTRRTGEFGVAWARQCLLSRLIDIS